MIRYEQAGERFRKNLFRNGWSGKNDTLALEVWG